MMTLQEFRRRTATGFLGRRNDAKFAYFDRLLEAFVQASATADQRLRAAEQMHVLVLVLEECHRFTLRHPTSASLPSVCALRQDAMTEGKTLLRAAVCSQSRGHGKTGWARLRAAVQPVIRGAQSGCLVMNTQYWGEAVVEEHYPFTGRDGAPDCFELWKASASRANYIDWLRDEHIPAIATPQALARTIRTVFSSVAYGDSADRARWRVIFRNGLLHDAAGELVHTGLMGLGLHGGWAIFVRTLDDRMYAHEPAVHAFHHSSFNAGGPVRSAGEIAVRHGLVIGVTNKSGHYTPSLTHFLDMLLWLQGQGADLDRVAACPQPFTPRRVFYNAADVLRARGAPASDPVPAPFVGAL